MDLSAPPTTSRPTPIPAVLRTAVGGTVVFPTDPWWDEAAVTWGLAHEQRPHALVIAASTNDVRATLAYAVHHGLRVAPQGNGNHPAALGDAKDTILLWTAVTTRSAAPVPAAVER